MIWRSPIKRQTWHFLMSFFKFIFFIFSVSSDSNEFYLWHEIKEKRFRVRKTALKKEKVSKLSPCNNYDMPNAMCKRTLCSVSGVRQTCRVYPKGTNFCGSQFWDFSRELNFAVFSLERKLEPFCELFDLYFRIWKILRELNFAVWAQIRKN